MAVVEFRCDCSQSIGPLPHFWEHTVGSDHAPMALRADWQEQLRRCHKELGFGHVRFHDLLSDDMGTLVNEQDRLIYSFFNVDQIFDFLLSIGMKPFVELSFMPSALSSGNTVVFKYQANVTPPRDYKQWATLIRDIVTHWVERYGVAQVRTWFFEVWNEPNLAAFWTGTRDDYFKLYRYTVEAIKQVDDQLRVGGPATANDQWITEFLDFCDQHQLPADFVSTHHYPTDALGSIGEDTLTQLQHSQRSWLRQRAQDTHRKARGRPVYYTEWNASSNPRDSLHDDPYTACVIVKTMLEARGLVQGYSFWTFSDIFEENYFPGRPFQGGFGLLTMQGVAKPSFRAFELLHRLGTEELLVDGLHQTVNLWVVRKAGYVTLMLINHALPRHPIQSETVRIALAGIDPSGQVWIERIDQDHANAKRLWLEMGEPKFPSVREVAELHAASQIIRERQPWTRRQESVHLEVVMPPQSVAAITVQTMPEPFSGELTS